VKQVVEDAEGWVGMRRRYSPKPIMEFEELCKFASRCAAENSNFGAYLGSENA